MKRITAFALAFFLALSCGLSVPASASTDASKTIAASMGILRQGSERGQLKINYEVLANTSGTSLGVKTIRLYKDNGTLVRTIIGTVDNGLIIEDGAFHKGTYCYNTATPGQYYYAEVTVFVTTETASDTYTHTTATIKAP